MDRTPIVKVSAVLGGSLAIAGGAAALLTGSADTVVVGGLATIAGGVAAIAVAVVSRRKPSLAAPLLVAAAMVVGLVAPGVIPGIADSIVIFFGYLGGATLIAAAAALAIFNRVPTPANATS
jgi:hypothetical protein